MPKYKKKKTIEFKTTFVIILNKFYITRVKRSRLTIDIINKYNCSILLHNHCNLHPKTIIRHLFVFTFLYLW